MSLMRRIQNLFRRDAVESEINAEILAHLELRIEDNVTRGMTLAEARRDAMLRFGNTTLIKEWTHRSDAALTIESVWADARYAVRKLRNSPTYSITAVLTIGLAIGANTAVFTLVHATLLRQLPFDEPARVFDLDNFYRDGLAPDMSSKNYESAFNAQAASFKTIEAASMYSSGGVNFSYESNGSQRLQASETSARFFDVLGVKSWLGRAFQASDDVPGNDAVAVISDRLWHSKFHGETSALGKTITLNGQTFKVIGVMPKTMDFPSNTDVWTPTIFDENTFLREGGAYMTWVIVRMRDGVTPEQMRAEFTARAQNRNGNQKMAEDQIPVLSPIAGKLTKSIRSSLLLLSGAVTLVLLIACANIAGLTLVRTAQRRAEFALRAALGAARGRLVRQQLIESVTLALAGAAIGILFAKLALQLLYVFKPAALENFPRPAIDTGVLIFTGLIAALTGLAFGMIPAWQASHEDPATALKAGVWRVSKSGARLRKILVAGEIATAFVLLIGAGLMMRTIVNLNRVPLGYETRNVLSFSISLHGAPYAVEKTTPALAQFYTNALGRLGQLPGVKSAAAVSTLPLDTRADMEFPVQPDGTKTGQQTAAPRIISSGYFRTIGTPLIEGRDFNERDTKTSNAVVIVTRDLAEKLWPNQNPLGHTIHCAFFCEQNPTVIGVVGESRRFGPRSEALAQFYVPYTQRDWTYMTFVLSSEERASILAPLVRSVVAAIDPSQPIYDMKTMKERLDDNQSLVRFEMFALGFFAMLAGCLAFVGLYGVIAYTVTQRTHEIGLRIALGAQRRRILLAVLREGEVMAVSGAAIGLIASLVLTKLITATLYGVTAHDRGTLALAVLLFLGIAFLASFIPARRAASVDPMVALRAE
jgi:predicted permease